MPQSYAAPRRRRWPLILAILLVVVGGVWAALWYYASGIAERTIAGWTEREVKSGRDYTCGSQTTGGFPLRFEVRCADARANLTTTRPPVDLRARELLVYARLWQPTQIHSAFVGPLTIAEPGQRPTITANWRSAETELHGLPTAPEQATVRVEEPFVQRVAGGDNLFKAARAEITGRMVSGTVRDNPVIEVNLKLVAAAAPAWHPAAANPVDADITAVMRGLRDFQPKPWPDRVREFQAAGGRIEITRARVQQGETIAVADGVLGLSRNGRLDGQLKLTVANLEKLLPALGLDKMMAPDAKPNQLNEAIGALDRLIPGLGNVARRNAGPAIIAGINLMGQQTELEGKKAVVLPLRFADGAVSLGPLLVGTVPPLF